MPLYLRLLISSGFCLVFLVSIQNFLVFPGPLFYFLKKSPRDPKDLPKAVESSFITTEDQKKLEIWKLPAKNKTPVAIIFHGNAGDIKNFFPYQEYFQSLGITSYAVDYRGYGRSTGWPTESGLEIDAMAAIEFVKNQEKISEQELILVGISVGTGPASFAATRINPPCLILFSPFTSIPNLMKDMPGFGFLRALSVNKMPVMENVRSLENTNTIVVHGENDKVVPAAHGRRVAEIAKGKFSGYFSIEKASHNDILECNHELASAKIIESINSLYPKELSAGK